MGTSKPGPHPRVSDEEILSVLREADSPVLSTADLAESLPIARRTTLNRLKQLHERGVVDSYTVGGRNTVWWLVDPDDTPIPDPDRERDYLKSFGKYEGTDLAESVAAVRERLGRDLRERGGRTRREDRE